MKSINFFLFISFLFSCTVTENENNVTQNDIKNGRTATLVLKRAKLSLVGRFSKVNVFINEISMGSIGNGDQQTFYFMPSQDGTTKLRVESYDMEGVGFFETLAQDTTLAKRFRKEIELKAKPGDVFKYLCTVDSKELVLREIEKTEEFPLESREQKEGLSTPNGKSYYPSKSTGYVRTKKGSSLRLRTEPSENGRIITKIPDGSFLAIIGYDNQIVEINNELGRWLKVNYKDTVGWAWGNFISID